MQKNATLKCSEIFVNWQKVSIHVNLLNCLSWKQIPAHVMHAQQISLRENSFDKNNNDDRTLMESNNDDRTLMESNNEDHTLMESNNDDRTLM